MAVSSPAADAFSPDPVRGNSGPDGPVGSGTAGGPLAGAHAIEGSGISGDGLPFGVGPPDATQQAAADGSDPRAPGRPGGRHRPRRNRCLSVDDSEAQWRTARSLQLD